MRRCGLTPSSRHATVEPQASVRSKVEQESIDGEKQRRALRPLLALNFFMADMQAGIGPFLGVFLLARGWHSG